MKKIVFTCVILFIITYSFFFPEITVYAARNGIQMWFHQILPALLPFTILSAILIKCNFLKSLKGNANLIACLLTMSCGFVFGFPVGAKLSGDFYKQKLLTKKQATLLAIGTNNFSPMYVCGFALSLLFSSKEYTTATYVLLYLVPLVLVSIYLIRLDIKHTKTSISSKQNSELNKSESNCNLRTTAQFHLDMHIMDSSIISGFEALIKICGYIVLFSIVTEILTTTITEFITQPPFSLMLILGNLEITNGINLLSEFETSNHLKYIASIQLLSFGGLSGIAQTGSILSEAGLSMHKYIIGKAALSLLLTLLSVIYVFFIRSL